MALGKPLPWAGKLEGDMWYCKQQMAQDRFATDSRQIQVPRLHALAALKRNGTEDLPIITYKGSAERQAQVAELRQACLEFLQAALGGDRLAAEYILLQLVSRSALITSAP